jgi:hypothetical protein
MAASLTLNPSAFSYPLSLWERAGVRAFLRVRAILRVRIVPLYFFSQIKSHACRHSLLSATSPYHIFYSHLRTSALVRVRKPPPPGLRLGPTPKNLCPPTQIRVKLGEFTPTLTSGGLPYPPNPDYWTGCPKASCSAPKAMSSSSSGAATSRPARSSPRSCWITPMRCVSCTASSCAPAPK